MPNTLLTSTAITNEALRVLVNSLALGSRCSRKYDDRYGVDGAKIGYTLSIRKPPRFLGTSGPGLGVEDITDSFVNLTLTNQDHVDTGITMADLRLSMVNFSQQYIKPAVATLANKVDLALAGLYTQIPYFVGTLGTLPSDLDTYLNAAAQLDQNSAPSDEERYCVLTPKMRAKIAFALKGLFNPQADVAQVNKKGALGEWAGMNFAWDQNIRTHSVGTISGAPTVTSVAAGGAAVTLGNFGAADTMKAGTILSFSGCYQVNVQSHEATTDLQTVTVLADVANDGAGNFANVPIWPPLIAAGANQTVDALPAAGVSTVLVFGNAAAAFAASVTGKVSPQALAFHRDALALACCDLEIPGGVDMSGRAKDDELGLSLRFVRAYDPSLDRVVSRLDILYGVVAPRPELAVRIIG